MAAESRFEHHIDVEIDTRHCDRTLAALAERQHGTVARWQLLELGIGRGALGRRLAAGRLHPIHRGVYAVGHRKLSPKGRLMAGVLAGGPGAVLSHRSAAELWRLRQNNRARIEITVPTSLRKRPGIEAHRASLRPDEITVCDGIPVTTVPRTLLDLAAVSPPRHVERALHEAEVLRLTDTLSLDDLLERHRGARGAAAIRKMIATARVGLEVSQSELEDRFLTLIAEKNLPRPRTNMIVEGYEADCVWPEERLIVELDGHASHATRHGFERDRERDRKLQAAGWRVIRITWRQLRDDPDGVAADLAALLR